eukprot:2860600-Rhodomonas_salina.1
MEEFLLRRSLRRCRWRAPNGRRRWRVPAWPEFSFPRPHPNPRCSAFAFLRCAASPRGRSPATAAPGRA